jgi:hypothetical protein
MPAELDACVEKVMAQGHDESSAFAICNEQLYGSSQKQKYGVDNNNMSFPPEKKDKPEGEGDGEAAGLELSQTEAEDTLSFITGTMETGQLPPELADLGQKVLGYFEGKANIQAEESSPPMQ